MGTTGYRFGIVICFLAFGLQAGASWMDDQATSSTKHLLDNISPSGAAAGAVVASPSKGSPDYFYHWIRDAGLVMNVVVDLWQKESDPTRKAAYDTILRDYVSFSRKNQTTPNRSDHRSSGRLGEPKFNADGSAYDKDWGRPQNDGPALRAIALIRVARLWVDQGKKRDVEKFLYDGKLPSDTVVKTDLEFISHEWKKPSFDIWEEISGQHFYTRLVQRRALVEGAKLAHELGDSGGAKWYEEQSALLEKVISHHWDAGKGMLLPTLDRDDGIDYKSSGVDTQVLLAVLHAVGEDGYYGVADGHVLSTMEKHIEAFRKLYSVNSKGYSAVAMGRYPEDAYDGLDTGRTGNPWFLITAAVAEMHYRIAKEIGKRSVFKKDSLNEAFLTRIMGSPLSEYRGQDKAALVKKIHATGDAFLDRVGFHADKDGRLSEQIHRDTGYNQGAPNLTWSYAGYLTAYWQR